MARHEADREDLMREATALVERGELQCPSFGTMVTAGFRRTGAMSVFIDQDPVYQFDPTGRLRRAFVEGYLYRSQGTGLAQLTRHRTETESILLREDLTPEQLSSFAKSMRTTLNQLLLDLEAGVVVLRAIPDGETLVQQCRAGLQQVLAHTTDWLSAEIRVRVEAT